MHGKRVLVVTNTTIAPLYLDKVTNALTHGNENISVESVILPDGEQYKNMVGSSYFSLYIVQPIPWSFLLNFASIYRRH